MMQCDLKTRSVLWLCSHRYLCIVQTDGGCVLTGNLNLVWTGGKKQRTLCICWQSAEVAVGLRLPTTCLLWSSCPALFTPALLHSLSLNRKPCTAHGIPTSSVGLHHQQARDDFEEGFCNCKIDMQGLNETSPSCDILMYWLQRSAVESVVLLYLYMCICQAGVAVHTSCMSSCVCLCCVGTSCIIHVLSICACVSNKSFHYWCAAMPHSWHGVNEDHGDVHRSNLGAVLDSIIHYQ